MNKAITYLAGIFVVCLLVYGAYLMQFQPDDKTSAFIEEWNAEETENINAEVAEAIIDSHRSMAKSLLPIVGVLMLFLKKRKMHC